MMGGVAWKAAGLTKLSVEGKGLFSSGRKKKKKDKRFKNLGL